MADVLVASTGLEEHCLQVFNTQTKELRTFSKPGMMFPGQCAFSDAGDLVAVCSRLGVEVFHVASAQSVAFFALECFSVAFVRHSYCDLLCGSIDGDLVHLDVAGKKEVRRSQPHIEAIKCIFQSSDGTLLATASNDHTIAVQTLATLESRCLLGGHEQLVNAVVLLPDNNTLISGSDDSTIKVWSVHDEVCTHTLTNHGSWVLALALTPNCKQMASASQDKSVILWDTPTFSVLSQIFFSSGVLTVLFSPLDDGVYAGVRNQGVVHRMLSRSASPADEACIAPHKGAILGLACSSRLHAG